PYSAGSNGGWTDRRNGVWDVAFDCSGHLSSLTAPSVTVDGTPQRPQTQGRHVDVQTTGCTTGTGTSSTPYTATLAVNVTATTTDARNYTTAYTVDAFAAPTQIIDAIGRVTTLQRDGNSRVFTAIAPSGHQKSYSWDGPRLTQTTDGSIGSAVYTSYESIYGRPTHVWGNTTEQWFFYTGAVLDSSRSRTPTTPATKYRTDSRGRVWYVADPAGHETYLSFETAGLQNTSTQTISGGRVTTFRHDNVGRVTATVYPNSTSDSTTYDVINRVRVTRDGEYHETRFDYDSLYLTSITDAKAQRYISVPNALGWVEQAIRPNSSTPLRQTFDASGNVTSVTNRRGGQVSYGYDAVGRPTTRSADGQTTTYGYSTWSGGSYQTVSNGESTDTLFLDGADRPSRLNTWRPNGSWYSEAPTFNLDGTRASLSATSNRWVGSKGPTYTYTIGPTLQYLDNFAGRTSFGVDAAESLPVSISFPNGLARTNGNTSLHRSKGPGYNVATVNTQLGVHVLTDSMGRLKQRSTFDSLKVYYYNDDGSLSARENYGGPGPLSCGDTPDFGVVCTGATLNDWTAYSYDAVGTLMNGVTSVDPGNQVRIANGYTYAYDADGNVIGKSGPGLSQTLVWNSLNQLTSITTNNVTVTFGYDGFGRRVRKGSTGYLHDGADLLLELDASGNPVAEYGYLPGIDQPFSVTRGGQTYYLTRDEVGGSVNGMVRASDNAVVAKYSFTPFGQLEAGSFDNVGNPIQFAARESDAETGLYYVRARYYDPQIGRFLSEDPIGLAGGINLYTYANNDPVNRSDPSGMWAYSPDGRGICSISLTSCGGVSELEEWMASLHGSGGASGRVSCYVGGNAERYASCMQLASNYLGTTVQGYGDEVFAPRYVAPPTYTKTTAFVVDFTDQNDESHYFTLYGASFKLLKVIDSGSWGVKAIYTITELGEQHASTPGEILLWLNVVPVQSSLVQIGVNQYRGGFTQSGRAGGLYTDASWWQIWRF
ncbi:MAG TPA: RHS repeat-associated core domain-containing protein, partial [Vicinamibacterales bacterium]